MAYRVLRVRGLPVGHECRLTVRWTAIVSARTHDQTIRYAFRTEPDFVLEPGRVLWDSGSVQARR